MHDRAQLVRDRARDARRVRAAAAFEGRLLRAADDRAIARELSEQAILTASVH